MTPNLECDLIMKGGITSGVVYPKAVTTLAESFQIRSIGGTSAGAIAATLTAAACYRKRSGDKKGFDLLQDLPQKLGEQLPDGKTRLLSLFKPQSETAQLYHFLLSLLGRASWCRIVLSLWGHYFKWALAGALVVAAPWLLKGHVMALPTGLTGWISLGLLLAVAFCAGIVGATGGVAVHFLKRVRGNNFSLCTGMGGTPENPALTEWLHELIQTASGKGIDKEPLVIGDLWGTFDPTAPRLNELVLMTTDITRGIPHRFPFIGGGNRGPYYFKSEDMERLFPADIVAFLKAKGTGVERDGTQEYYPLPQPADLPVLVGMRLSLSFPILLAAVPLYAKKYERRPAAGGKKEDVARWIKCWFSDGGIISNFPVHFFDTPLPTRPTFAINLAPATAKLAAADVAATDEETDDSPTTTVDKMVSMPTNNSAGSTFRFNEFEAKGVPGFLSAVVDAARNWSDIELATMPGYRDRIVHIKLSDNEGGLNLDMPSDLITKLADRGEDAAKLVIARFATTTGANPVALGWDNHRWVRLRSLLAAFEKTFSQIHAAWHVASPQTPESYAHLIQRQNQALPSYTWPNNTDQQEAAAEAGTLAALIADWHGKAPLFDRPATRRTSPRPKPQLRMMPPGDSDPKAI